MLGKFEFVKKNKKLIAGTIAFVAGGLAAIGYGIPQPIIELIYKLLDLGVLN